MSNYISCLVSFLLAAVLNTSASESLFHDGKTEWKIYLSAQADQTERYAAEELQNALKKISGADFEVVCGGEVPESTAIVIGDLSNPEIQSKADVLKLSPGKTEEVAVHTLGGRLYLAGNQPRGALYAVYSFLQNELGVRWLWPGTDGEFIPVKASWSLPDLKFNHRPDIQYRGFHLCGAWRDHEIFRQWMARNFINIHRHAANAQEKRMGFYSMWSSHNANLPATLFDQHPEYFAEVNGKHYKENICLSNPTVDKIVADSMSEYVCKHPFLDILSVFPNDNETYCRCTECAKKDVSTVWFEFYNRLTDTLKKEFPELKFATIAYQGYLQVPKCQIRNSEFVEYATYMRCNIHPFGTPGCKLNEDMMTSLQQWKATGRPVGNYAYEYDILWKNGRFVPFLSMIDDAIKNGKKLGHVSMITEILLSPKPGPAVYVNNVQNRLSIYLYARLLWEPDQKMSDILRDWCRTAFGEAAAPMYDYYTGMDRAWSAMPAHRYILGDALGIVQPFFSDKLKKEAVSAFTSADQALSKTGNLFVRERASAAIEREKILFKQWQDLSYMKRDDIPRLNLPLLAQPEDFPKSSSAGVELKSPNPDVNSYPADVRVAWTRDAILVKWVCQDPHLEKLKVSTLSWDGKVDEDDSVELILCSGVGGETWHFAANPKGITQDYRDSCVGVREDQWNPDWQVKTQIGEGRWEVEMTIPFASLSQMPNPNEIWTARFLRHNGGRSDFVPVCFPAKETAMLSFSSAACTDRVLLWWSGAPDRESGKDAALKQDFSQAGWQIKIATTKDDLLALDGKCRTFWFRHPNNGKNSVPDDYWKNALAPAVRDGALAVFVSYWNIPLEKYFDDPALKVKLISAGGPLVGRRSKFIAPGDWSAKPNNLLSQLKDGITPSYGFVPEDPAAWTVLATAPYNDGTEKSFPYIMAKPYGKGMIILCGDSIPISAVKMLENFIQYHEIMKGSPAPSN